MAEKFNKTLKSDMEHAYDDVRDEARAKARQITRRVTDVVYVEIDKVFREALLRGEEITSITLDVDEIFKKAFPIIKKQLGA